MRRNRFFPYLLANYPDPVLFAEVLELTSKYADTIEIGIPFTDPIGDGPVIARASSAVIAQSYEVESVFHRIQKRSMRVPIAMMSYANPILAYGRVEFCKACKQCGVQYLIVPDVPFEESAEWRSVANEQDLAWISFVSLLTGELRLKQIAQSSEGFIYLLALKGITGANIQDSETIRAKAKEIKSYTDVPIALGFGVKNVEDTVPYRDVVDAFIVGSKIIDLLETRRIDLLENFYESFTRAR